MKICSIFGPRICGQQTPPFSGSEMTSVTSFIASWIVRLRLNQSVFAPSPAPSTLHCFQTKTIQYNAENDQRKRINSKTLSRVERFEKGTACLKTLFSLRGRRKRCYLKTMTSVQQHHLAADHSKTGFEKNCFSAWASTLNMGLINKVDMVCLSPVHVGRANARNVS